MHIPALGPLDYLGFAGTLIIVAAYALNQARLLASDDWRYPLVNLLGSVLILSSLFTHFNAASMLIELFWIAISLGGVLYSLRSRRRKS